MRIGFLSTRLAGSDGVSLETAKWAAIYRTLGHETVFCAGELDPALDGALVPTMHFTHPAIQTVQVDAFGQAEARPGLLAEIEALAKELTQAIQRFVEQWRIDCLVVENALTIPMNVPLGLALADFIEANDFPAVAHHHDFYWERERFTVNAIQPMLDRAFPATLPTIRHAVINAPAQESLRRRCGVESVIVPNIFDYDRAAPALSDVNANLRHDLGLSDEHLLILQPTRVVPRKGIELAINFVARLQRPENRAKLGGKQPVLLISHHAGDEGMDYLHQLQAQAVEADVDLRYVPELFATAPVSAHNTSAHKISAHKISGDEPTPTGGYSLWDAYVHADFVTYPSLYEGFGNALLEALYFRLPALVNRYPIYVTDIGPKGFDLVEIDGAVTDESVAHSIHALMDPVRRRRMTERNYHLARSHFSYEAVQPILAGLLPNNT